MNHPKTNLTMYNNFLPVTTALALVCLSSMGLRIPEPNGAERFTSASTNPYVTECDKKFTTNIDRVVHVQVRYNCKGNCAGDRGSEIFAFDLQGYQDEHVMQVNGQVCHRSRVDGYNWSDWTSGGCLEARITTWGKSR